MNPQEEYYKRNIRSKKEFFILLIKIAIYVPLAYSFEQYSDFYEQRAFLGRAAYALSTFLIVNIIVSISRMVVISLYLRRSAYTSQTRGSFVLGVNRIASVINSVFLVIALMLLLKIDPVQFVTSITIVAMAIALLFKEYITNMISGLIVMFSDQLSLGDYIKMADQQGKIVDITLTNIVLLNDDDDIVLIPNNLVFTSNIINQSVHNTRMVTIEFELPLGLSSNQAQLETTLHRAVEGRTEEVVAKSFRLKVLSIQKDHVRYKVQFLLTPQGKQNRQKLKKAMMDAIIATTGNLPSS